MDRDAGPAADVELTREQRPRRRLGLLAINVVVIAAALAGIYVLAARDDPGEASPTTTTEAPSSTSTPTAEDLFAVVPASPIDGKQSQRLPVMISQRADLADGQVVTVLAKGFSSAERVGVVMCVAEAAIHGVEACDLGTNGDFDHVTYGDATGEGFVQVDIAVRQLITTPLTGPVDCASSAERCLVAVGAISDYDRSGGAPVGFLGQPPFPEPTQAVSVAGPYAPDQQVDLVAGGLLWPREVQYQLCLNERCAVLARGRVNADGTFNAHVALPWAFTPVDGTVVTCETGCELRLGYLALPETSDAPAPAPLPVTFHPVDSASPPMPATAPPTTAPPITAPPITPTTPVTTIALTSATPTPVPATTAPTTQD